MSGLQRIRQYGARRGEEILENLAKNNLLKRILKNTIATTAAVSISLIPGASKTIGKAAYLGAMTTVFGHPGRRFGQLAEALILTLAGALLGLAWSISGLYLSSLSIQSNPTAGYAVRAIFLTVALMIHGFLRSYAPRLFVALVLLIIVSVVNLLSTAVQVTRPGVTQIIYPVLVATGVILVVNLCIFPEFSSSFLGQMTIETLNETAVALERAGYYFTYSDNRAAGEKDEMPDVHSNHESGSGSGQKTGSHRRASATSRPRGSSVVVNLTHPSVTKEASHHSSKATPTLSVVAQASGKAAEAEQFVKISIGDLTAAKVALRKKLSDCKSAQSECNFELAYAVLPPRDLKPISGKSMTKLIANVVAVISTCESKFALVGDFSSQGQDSSQNDQMSKRIDNQSESSSLDPTRLDLKLVKPKREIEFGDVRLLRYLLMRVKGPHDDLMRSLSGTIAVIISCIAYVYGVPKLPDGVRPPETIVIEDLDLELSKLQQALQSFDSDTTSALEGAAMMQQMKGQELDIMPREELFLISSFLLNLRQAATHVQEMLRSAHELVEKKQMRRGRRRLYAPRIKWASWLLTGGDQDEAMPVSGRKADRRDASTATDIETMEADDSDQDRLIAGRTGKDEEKAVSDGERARDEQFPPSAVFPRHPVKGPKSQSDLPSVSLQWRGWLADALEWVQESDDFLYASKLTVAVILVSWPAWIPSWNLWYSLNRGLWAALQLVFVTEVSIGTSIWTFFVRGVGTTLGCIWGWAAWEARNGNPIVCAVMICIGVIPSAYLQLGSKYPKAGMVSIISMCVVALSTELKTVPGTATENFLKRWIAFMIGGAVAVLVEMVLLPVKARTRMVESLAAALRHINEMEGCIAAGIEEGKNFNIYNTDRILRFERASRKANGALGAAETFLPFCGTEPRIKGSFGGLALIYDEILFVLHQIVDRMDNMLQLRTAYGSGPLEEFNAQIYPYRRNVAGSITVTLFAVRGALLTKIPLPQFLPSARLAHLRMINRVREVVQQAVQHDQGQENTTKLIQQLAVRRKYMSWNASSAAQAEIIEFLEELVDLAKLLVGANEFRSGLLVRPTHPQYRVPTGDVAKPISPMDGEVLMEMETQDEVRDIPSMSGGFSLRRRTTTRSQHKEGEDIPPSLKRIQSRKIEAGIRRQKTNDTRDANVK